MMKRLIPKVFYDSMDDRLELFVNGLGFKLMHRDDKLAVVQRDGVKACVVEDPEFAAKDRPELTIETDTIDALFAEIAAARPVLLHPNLKVVTKRPWGEQEFAVLDRTGVCVVFRQW